MTRGGRRAHRRRDPGPSAAPPGPPAARAVSHAAVAPAAGSPGPRARGAGSPTCATAVRRRGRRGPARRRPPRRVLPGAQQLELLRRLNLAGGVAPDLADRVLTAAAPGRGKPDLALVGVPRSRLRPPSGRPRGPARRRAGPGRHQRARRGRRPARRARAARGLPRPVGPPPPGGRGPGAGRPPRRQALGPRRLGRGPMVVVGAPLDQMLADVWTRRCFERGSGAWPEWLRFWQQRDQLPPRLDLPAVAERHAASPGGVVVVLDASALPHALGVRRLPAPRRPGADAAELARRIATVVGLLVPPDAAGGPHVAHRVAADARRPRCRRSACPTSTGSG